MTMMQTIVKDTAYYMNLHYKIILEPEDDGSWGAVVPDLLGCAGAGKTIEEALASLNGVKETWFESRLLRGAPIPEPSPNAQLGSTLL